MEERTISIFIAGSQSGLFMTDKGETHQQPGAIQSINNPKGWANNLHPHARERTQPAAEA
jgi:hypothetical protein